MTVRHQWPLQQAVYRKLVEVLSGQGIDGADIPIFDHVPNDPPRLHLRIDGFSVLPSETANGDRAFHQFSVHIFDDNTGENTGAGTAEIARLQSVVVGALTDWTPIDGATGLRHHSSYSAADENPLVQHGISKFSTFIGG